MSRYMFRLNGDTFKTPTPCFHCFSYFAYVCYDIKNENKQEKNTPSTNLNNLNNVKLRLIDMNTYVRENNISLFTVNICYNR